MAQHATATVLAAILALVGNAATATPETDAPAVAPVDVETRLDGMDFACTGIGADARNDPRWLSYNLRIEFSNALNEYVVGGNVSVRNASGRVLLNVSCDAPWLLLRAPPGSYVVEGRLSASAAKARSARVVAPAKGQLRVVLQFPDA